MRLNKLLTTSAIAVCAMTASTMSALAQDAPTDETEAATELEAFTAWRDIDAFRSWGDIDAFRSWGDIEAFRSWGDIEAFRSWRDIEAFRSWGDIEAFRSWGDIEAFRSWGDIEAFGQALDQFWGGIEADWLTLASMDDNSAMLDALNSIFDQSKAFWGAAITEQTGLSFEEAFANELLTKYGIDLNDASSLDDFDLADLVYFQFAWQDGLMDFTGVDQIDWWMQKVHWTPTITEVQGGGDGVVIGLIDSIAVDDVTLRSNLLQWDGSQAPVDGHGGAVASLLVADHDGQGVMGIAPGASVAAYNPFDEFGHADWDSVAEGVKQVSGAGASVVNLSLGVPGTTFDDGWADLYKRWDIQTLTYKTVFVHAAGNDGVTQTEDVNWGFDLINPVILLVGSVGLDGEISDFSNRPGEACIRNGSNQCETYLKDIFLVAPGEWILVSDAEGGVTRANGTSFSAPLVSGSIALLHGRWPWLKDYAQESADIILTTADDLGEPGVDPVYGHGLLNIEASQSPIDWSNTYVYQDVDGAQTQVAFSESVYADEQNSIWETKDSHFTVYEDIGETYRDFQVPLETQLVNTLLNDTVSSGEELIQDALSSSVLDASVSTTTDTSTSDKDKKDKKDKKFSFVGSTTEYTVSYAPLAFGEDAEGRMPYRVHMMGVTQSGAALRLGQGDGATRLGFTQGAADGVSNPVKGGVNPVLGFASGGFYAGVEMPLANGLRLSVGATERKADMGYDNPYSGERQKIYDTLADYRSVAVNTALTQSLTERLSVTASYTALSEDRSLFGMQSLDPTGFGAGSSTDAATIGAAFAADEDMLVTASATFSKSRSQDENAAFVADDVATSAFEVAMLKHGVFSDNDAMRVALVQPMHVENGVLNVESYEVVDRTTGELGMVENSFDVTNGERRLAVEARYGARFEDSKTEISAFVRFEGARGDSSFGELDQLVGARIAFQY